MAVSPQDTARLSAEQIRDEIRNPSGQPELAVYLQAAHDAEVLRRLREELVQESKPIPAGFGDGIGAMLIRAEHRGVCDALERLDRLMVEVPYE